MFVILLLSFFYRLQVDDLEKTSLESEVYDLDVEGQDDIGEDISEQVSSSTNNEDTKVEIIQPADIFKTEYCIVAATKLIHYSTEFMAKYVSDLDVTNYLNSKKHIVAHVLWLPGSVMQGILVEGGPLNRLVLVFGQGICCWQQQLLFLVIHTPKLASFSRS